MKIVHISDVHIRNLKYHDEYRRVFDNLYREIERIKPDLVVNTGDTAHTKTQISPEFVEMTSQHIKNVIELAPYYIIPGNHDLNLMNKDRQDAITPIVESINDPRIHFHKKSGLVEIAPGFNFWVFSLADSENYPLPSAWAKRPDDVNIGLFHGSVLTCVTDSNWRMTHVEHDLSIFDGLDFALLGDIHKQQFFRDGRIGYAGSLIQQNFGEELHKGFLVWDIKDKNNFTVTPHYLTGSRKFHTVRLQEDLGVPDLDVEEGSRIRISPPRSITLVEQKEAEKNVKAKFKPYDVITLSSAYSESPTTTAAQKVSDVENLRQIEVQEKLIKEFLEPKNLPENILAKILEMNRRYQIHIDQNDDGARNVSWKINKLAWSNLFNYGENNVIDFDQLGGLTGLFAPNGSGKSNFIDVILETCFDATTKGISKNIHIINDNKDVASAIADVSANEQKYEIERNIERVKYGQRSRDSLKEWGKTTVKFSKVDDAGDHETLVGTLRPETEKNIRQRLGTFDDFLLTSLSAQWNPTDIISSKETKRKEIFYKFLDLDVFGHKALLAKDESREFVRQLADMEDNELEENAKKYQFSIDQKKEVLEEKLTIQAAVEGLVKELEEEILAQSGQKVKVDRFQLGDWAGNIKKAEKDISVNNAKVTELSERLTSIEEDLAKVLKLESRFDLKFHEEKAKRWSECETEAQVQARLLGVKEKDHSLHQKNAALLGEVPCGDQFPSCKFLVNAFDSKKKLASMLSEIDDIRTKMNLLIKEKSDLQQYKEKLEKYKQFVSEKEGLLSRRDNIKLQLENIRLKVQGWETEKAKALEDKARYEQAEEDIRKNDELEAAINELQTKKVRKSNELQKIQKEIMEVNRQLGSDQGIMEKLATQVAQLQELRDTCSAYEHYISAMGKDGIAYQIFTQKLPLINEEINKILSNSADFTVFLEHDVEEQSIRFYIQYGEYKSRLLELGSGAEKFLASIAIRNALLNISILPKTNMFIIDEGFGKLDPKNLEAVHRMFDYLKTVFDHVIVVSHLDTMKDIVDNIIDITTDEEGYAHVEIGG